LTPSSTFSERPSLLKAMGKATHPRLEVNDDSEGIYSKGLPG
jgi:hypothetical protein